MSTSKPNSTAPLTTKSQINDKLSKLKKRNYIVGDSEDVVHVDWSSEWTELNLDSESERDNHG